MWYQCILNFDNLLPRLRLSDGREKFPTEMHSALAEVGFFTLCDVINEEVEETVG